MTDKEAECPSCGGLNTSCPEGCGRDPATGELDGSTLNREAPMKDELNALADRVEAATEGGRMLDRDIAVALGDDQPDGAIYQGTPAFTTSIDAAMTLWPGEVPHLIPSNPRICAAMALRARANNEQGEK